MGPRVPPAHRMSEGVAEIFQTPAASCLLAPAGIPVSSRMSRKNAAHSPQCGRADLRAALQGIADVPRRRDQLEFLRVRRRRLLQRFPDALPCGEKLLAAGRALVRRDAEERRGLLQKPLLFPLGALRSGSGCEVQADDAVLDLLGLDDADRPRFRGVLEVRTTAGLDVGIDDIHDAEPLARHRPSLVDAHPEALLRDIAAEEGAFDRYRRADDGVRLLLDGSDFLGREVLVVGEVEVRLVGGLLRAGLVDMRSQHAARGGVQDVRCRMMLGELYTPFAVYLAAHARAARKRRVALQLVHHGVAVLEHVDDTDALHGAGVVDLASAGGIEVRLLQHNLRACGRCDLADKGRLRIILEVERLALGHLGQVHLALLVGGVRLLPLLVQRRDLRVEVVRHRHVAPEFPRGIAYHLWGDAVAVVELEELLLADIGLHQALHHRAALLPGRCESLLLHLEDGAHLVQPGRELGIHRLEVLRVPRADLGEVNVPLVLLDEAQRATQDGAQVVPASDIRGQPAVRERDEQGTRMLRYGIDGCKRQDGLPQLPHRDTHLLSDAFPCLLDVADLVHVEIARIGEEARDELRLRGDSCASVEFLRDRGKGGFKAGALPLAEPRGALLALPHVQHLEPQVFISALVLAELHVDLVRNLQPPGEELDAGAEIAAPGPAILVEGQLGLVQPHPLAEPAVQVQEIVVRPVFRRRMEAVLAHHHEARVVRARDADIVDVIEAQAELRHRQRVRGRLYLAVDDIGDEVVDARLDELDVAPPPRHDRIARDGGVAALLQDGGERLPHADVVQFALRGGVADEPEASGAGGVPADSLLCRTPEEPAARALPPGEAELLHRLRGIVLFPGSCGTRPRTSSSAACRSASRGGARGAIYVFLAEP